MNRNDPSKVNHDAIIDRFGHLVCWTDTAPTVVNGRLTHPVANYCTGGSGREAPGSYGFATNTAVARRKANATTRRTTRGISKAIGHTQENFLAETTDRILNGIRRQRPASRATRQPIEWIATDDRLRC